MPAATDQNDSFIGGAAAAGNDPFTDAGTAVDPNFDASNASAGFDNSATDNGFGGSGVDSNWGDSGNSVDWDGGDDGGWGDDSF